MCFPRELIGVDISQSLVAVSCLNRFLVSVNTTIMHSHCCLLFKREKLQLFFICQAMGVLLGVMGIYLLMNYRQTSLFFSHTYVNLPVVIALASGVFLVVGGCLGSWLSLRDSTCLQGLVRFCVWLSVCASVFGLSIIKCSLLQFVYLLVLVFCLESTASALAYIHSTKV